MKKVVPMLVGMIFLLSFSSAAFAGGNWRHGKKVFKSECMSCHKRHGEAKRLKLNRKSKAAWTKFVKQPPRGKHKEVLDSLSDTQKKDMLQYFLKYAKDDHSSHLGCG